MTDQELLAVALEEARAGLAEGGIPIGAALFDGDANLLGRGHNRRVQGEDPVGARRGGGVRQRRPAAFPSGDDDATTLAPCCS